MSNLIKSNFIYFNNQEKRVIDSNLVRQIAAPVTFSKDFETEWSQVVQGSAQEEIHNLEENDTLQEEQVSLRVEKIISEAEKEAEDIITAAREQAQQILVEAREEARNEGYQEGYQAGEREAEQLKNQLNEEIARNTAEYNESLVQLEPKFVGIVITLIEKITGVMIEDKKDVILYLVNRAMNNIESNKNFIIKVSKGDYHFLQDHIKKIHSEIRDDVQIEILEDLNLTKNQCIIETETRIIDCSLDVQLSNLITDLKLLSNI